MASQAMRQLEPEQQQAVINEAAVRCARGEIRKPVAYLMGLIKRACQGEFTLWAAYRGGQDLKTDFKSSEACASRASQRTTEARWSAHRLAPRPLCLEELKQRCRGSLAPT